MRDHSQWSVNLGRFRGVQVRLHLFFLLFAAFTLYLSWLAGQPPKHDEFVWAGVLSIGILAASVLVHECGHVWAARRLGVVFDHIVLWPLGGMTSPERVRDPQAEFLIQLAGPVANLILAALCLPPLLADEPAALLHLINPLKPEFLVEGTAWLVTWKLIFWINWMLAIINFFPAFPFDGGRILRAALLWHWGEAKRERATLVVSILAQVCAVLLLVVAYLARDWHASSQMPTWFALVILSIFLFFSASHERQRPAPTLESDDQPFGYDFSQGYTSLERSYDDTHEEVGPITRWLEERREQRQKRQQEVERDEDARMDELLSRISMQGIESLSSEERLLLERVSARYRQRHEKDV
jgi:stage IV sporulation protein FB